MDVIQEILKWSEGRHDWQRDALRRLVVQGDLNEFDLDELTELCKLKHGLSKEGAEAKFLEAKHLPERGDSAGPVTLTSLTHHTGVNALAPDQVLRFGPQLTVVYGGNAAGKSGYARVLKRACRARGAEEILGNVTSGAAPPKPSATISYKVGESEDDYRWSDEDEPATALGEVSVFDRHCEAVYLRKRTNVAFRPFGLDLFDQLAAACKEVRRRLDGQKTELERRVVALPEVPPDTEAGRELPKLTSLTDVDELRRLAILSAEEEKRLSDIDKELEDLRAGDPKKAAQALRQRADRLQHVGDILGRASAALCDEAASAAIAIRDHAHTARKEAEGLRAETIPAGTLAGSGSDKWRSLWEAARLFSTDEAYPAMTFPVTEDEARCVLCQQALKPDGKTRLSKFEEFVTSVAERSMREADAALAAERRKVEALEVRDQTTATALDEARLEAPELADAAEASLVRCEARKSDLLQALAGVEPCPAGWATPDTQALGEEEAALRERAERLENPERDAREQALVSERRELDARRALGLGMDAVVQEVNRKKEIAAFELCRKDAATKAITDKSAAVTKETVTNKLKAAFQAELDALEFNQVEVELQDAGGGEGALYHKLVLKRAPGTEVPSVVSEGEARCLAIAAFFAELATAPTSGGILFDDPVSSLDHNWREMVAKRLVAEAAARQVIVFTHDLVFLLALEAEAKGAGVDHHPQHLRREGIGAGVSSPEMPWVAMPTRKRLGVLNNEYQAAEKLHRDGSRSAYERQATYLYGRLRETWERAFEEVLLANVVQRYRPSVQTQQVHDLAHIEPQDCIDLEAGMTKTSRWLPGHDKAAAENTPIPEPPELRQDIEALAEWVKRINDRRKQAKKK
ncbi:MAG: AAA family ATPase [Planctomycetota bacterium]